MRNDTKFLKTILIFSLLGILISGWLLSLHLKFTTGQALLTESCSLLPGAVGDSQGCASIAVSDYSKILDIPLPALAMGFYFSLFFLVFWAWRNPQTCYEPLYVAFSLSTISIPITVFLFYLSKYKVQNFCMGCSVLWLVNLAIWPCFVKHLGLRWGNAWMANLEIFRSKNLNLLRSRVIAAYSVSIACIAILSATGVAAVSLQNETTMHGDLDRAILEYQNAKQLFLPPEAYIGPQVKMPTDSTKAPILDIVEFSDLQCPACKMAARYFKPFLLKYKDKVRFSYRNFPLDGSCNAYVPNGMHRYACAAARAAICAGEQGKFFTLHDLIFDNQENLNDALIESLAKEAQLDMSQYASCLKDPKTEASLQQDIQWGELIGLESTPTIIINGRKLTGAVSPQQLEALLKSIESGKMPVSHSTEQGHSH